MNLMDLAKKTIDEVNTEILQTQTNAKKSLDNKALNSEKTHKNKTKDFKKRGLDIQQNHYSVVENFDQNSADDKVFLNKVKERLLVLFEGLRASKEEDLQNRLNLTINFLEFLLAKIEDKLKK